MEEKTLKELLKLWYDEQNHYKETGVGSGVQKFVKEVLKNKNIFNLKEGKLNTSQSKRNREFLEEIKNKGRRADIVIFIDSEIIIPVEVKRYGNIQEGESQLFQYQSDWIKKYGLLTDGNEWRFYNNRFSEISFNITDILNNPTDFLTFWNEYIKSNYYYRSFFEKKGHSESFEEQVPALDKVKEDFFIDITKLIENIENKLNLKGYFFKEKNETDRKKKAIEITYAYLIQFILYKVLVDNAFYDFEDDWKQRIKSIDKAIKAETYGDVLTKIKGISDKISDKIYKRFNDEQLMINDRLKDILSKPTTEITDVSVWLDILLFINRYNFSNVQNDIFGYVYENYLKDLYLDEKKGQYFTDPNIVEFMLNEMGYTKENIQKRYKADKDSISLMDPSCGSGTFLYNATNRIVESFFDGSQKSAKLTEELISDNIFGLDIAEFPLYLAEMNILMRMLPMIINKKYNNPYEKRIQVFVTEDSVAEFLNTPITNTLTDLNIQNDKTVSQISLFTDLIEPKTFSFLRNKDELKGLKNSLFNNGETLRYRYDFIVGNPPYLHYNECSKQNIKFFELLKQQKVKLNDVYGFNLHSIPNKPKPYRPNPNIYAFFIALGMALLKDNGVLCFVIPQTILNAGDLDVLRYNLSKYFTLLKIITFTNAMFIGRGLNQKDKISTSSLILIIEKCFPKSNQQVEIINYNKSNFDINNTISDISKNRK